MSKQFAVDLTRRAEDHPPTRQIVRGTLLIDTGDEHLDARIWHIWHYAHVQVSELMGIPKRLGMDVVRRHDPLASNRRDRRNG